MPQTPMEPALVLIYGKSKIGKTVDCLYSFPRALYIAAPGALSGAASVCGYELRPGQVRNGAIVKDVMDAIKAAAAAPKGADGTPAFSAVVVDDLSLIVDQTVMDKKKRLSGFELWGAVRHEMIDLRTIARACGIHVVFNAHEMQPGKSEDTGVFYRGGPRLPGKMVEDLPAICDCVLHAEATERSPYVTPGYWPAFVRNDVSLPWVVGDRNDVFFDGAPMNTGEGLRAAGHKIARLPGLEWQEAAVEQLAGTIVGLAAKIPAQTALTMPLMPGQARDYMTWGEIIAAAEENVRARYTKDENIVRWTVRDAPARAHFRMAARRPHRHFGV